MVRDAPNGAGGEAFMAYVLGPDGQAVLRKWGFAVGG
jgi:ABC-type molybdate transport system substrate-binding protein